MDIKWGTEGSWYFLAIQNEIADTFLANTHHYIQLHDHSFYLHILHFYSYNVFSFSIKAVKVVDDEVQGFHDSDVDEQRCYWVRKCFTQRWCWNVVLLAVWIRCTVYASYVNFNFCLFNYLIHKNMKICTSSHFSAIK